MNWPFQYKENYDVSNNFFYLPADLFKEQQKEELNSQRGTFPLVSYLANISNKDKFRFIVIMIVVIAFFYRLNLHSSIWLGLLVAIIFVYYLNEEQSQKLNNETDELWNVLKSPLLNKTKYFIGDPKLIKFIQDVSDFKKYNVLEFNLMVKTLDNMLRTIFDLKQGITNCKENYDIFKDLKVGALNIFQSLLYKLPYVALREKHNYYFRELGLTLNDRENMFLRICKLYHNSKPVTTSTSFFDETLDDPVPIDPSNDKSYDFYN